MKVVKNTEKYKSNFQVGDNVIFYQTPDKILQIVAVRVCTEEDCPTKQNGACSGHFIRDHHGHAWHDIKKDFKLVPHPYTREA